MSSMYSLLIVVPALYLVHVLSQQAEPHHFRRYENLDGLRGFAALGVFLSHASLFYFFDTTKVWSFPEANFANSFYNHCGVGAVIMFFMMSSFLFYGKVRESFKVDWVKIYTSRVFRLFPMYYLSSVFGILFVYFIYGKNHHITVQDILWIAEFKGVGDVFGVHNVPLMTNGTAWTLPYEWALYFSLPVVWMLLHRRITFSNVVIVAAALVTTVVYVKDVVGLSGLFLYFSGGIVAYEIEASRFGHLFKRFAVTKTASFVALVVFALIVCLTYKAGQPLVPNSSIGSKISFIGYFIIFLILSLGNNMFGLLTSHAARKLGEISYSFYILQFIVLWAFFEIVFKHIMLSPLEHFAVGSMACVVLILVSNLTFSQIEKRIMAIVPNVAKAINSCKTFK